MKENLVELPKRLRALKGYLGLTTTLIQQQTNGKISKSAYSRWEHGETYPNYTDLVVLVDTFSINPEWLFFGVGEMFKKEEKKTEQTMLMVAAEEMIQYQKIVHENEQLKNIEAVSK